MIDYCNILGAFRKSSLSTIENIKPSNLLFGKVISINPLKIDVGQNLILSDIQLILSRNVTDYDIDMSVNHITESSAGGGGAAAYASHDHEYKGKKTFTIHNSLVIGDSVILGQIEGGQSFIVIDRIGNVAI